jgi:hypothetical protein
MEDQMVKITIDINSESPAHEPHSPSSHHPFVPAATFQEPIIFISTIKLQPDLKQAFDGGTGGIKTIPFYSIDYDALDDFIQTKDKPNTLIVLAAGSLGFELGRQHITKGKFVSTVGLKPTGNLGNCLGGVTLNSISSNKDRVDWLTNVVHRPRANIGLFCNPKSQMNPAEEYDWTHNIPGVDQHIIHGGSRGNPPKNDATHYQQELQAADGYGITTLIVSADPFFNHTKDLLIAAANAWAGSTKHVCYPLADYANTNGLAPPNRGYASWYGPSLVDVYEQLGVVAGAAFRSGGFQDFADSIDDKNTF